METQTKRIIAEQQPELVKSEIAVKVLTQKKQEMITLAEGKAASLKLEGQGEGDEIELAGKGEAAKIDSIGLATANACEKQKQAMGQDSITIIKIVEILSDALKEGKIKIVPDVLVTGTGNATDGLMGMTTKVFPGVDINGLLARLKSTIIES